MRVGRRGKELVLGREDDALVLSEDNKSCEKEVK